MCSSKRSRAGEAATGDASGRASFDRRGDYNLDMKLLHVVGARPNYMKAAAVVRAARAAGLEQKLIHTGQHYGAAMSEVFFEELGLPPPDRHLAVGSGSHGEQTARIMMAIEPVIEEARPDWVVVVGDVNSTLAATLTAVKLGVKVAHVEAGLRSFDRSMPEELNRLVTDALADLLLTPSPDADENLAREGRERSAIRRVGNVMIDMLDANLGRARARRMGERLGLSRNHYALATLHRPGNVDGVASLGRLLGLLGEVASRLPVVLPLHPRTRARLDASGLAPPRGLVLHEPLGYLDFLSLLDGARLVLTDSGGVQEETTALGVPCLTLRDNTERPITITEGTNLLVGSDGGGLLAVLPAALAAGATREGRTVTRPALWDGHAAERVVAALIDESSRTVADRAA